MLKKAYDILTFLYIIRSQVFEGEGGDFLKSESLNYELDTKNFHFNFARFVGAVDGSGFAPVVYEMPEM